MNGAGTYDLASDNYAGNPTALLITITGSTMSSQSLTDPNGYSMSYMIAGSLDGTHVYFATGSNGVTYGDLTQGVGMTLTRVMTTIGSSIYYVACDTTGQYVVCVTSVNVIYYSNNYGISGSWTASTQTAIANLFNLTCIGSGSSCYFIIADKSNNLYISTDQGITFTINAQYNGSNKFTLNNDNNSFGTVSPNDTIGYLGTTIFIGTQQGNPIIRGVYTLPPPPVICFLEGTKLLYFIDDKEIYVPIQDISRGALVKTLLSGYKPVELIGFSKLYNPGNTLHSKNRLYKCSPEQYPELTEDLIITGCHSILVDEITDIERERTIAYLGRIFVTDRKYRLIACLDNKAEPYPEEGIHTIWHLALENDSYYMNYGIYANGLLVETTSLRMMTELSGMELVQ